MKPLEGEYIAKGERGHLIEPCQYSAFRDHDTRQLQRLYNYRMSLMAENAAMGKPCFDPEPIINTHA